MLIYRNVLLSDLSVELGNSEAVIGTESVPNLGIFVVDVNSFVVGVIVCDVVVDTVVEVVVDDVVSIEDVSFVVDGFVLVGGVVGITVDLVVGVEVVCCAVDVVICDVVVFI